MTAVETDIITRLVADKQQEILSEWLELLKDAGTIQTGRISESELIVQCRDFLRLFRDALAKGAVDVATPAYTSLRDFLGDISRSRALQGFTPRETAIIRIFVEATFI